MEIHEHLSGKRDKNEGMAICPVFLEQLGRLHVNKSSFPFQSKNVFSPDVSTNNPNRGFPDENNRDIFINYKQYKLVPVCRNTSCGFTYLNPEIGYMW